ncbi:MAG: cytochrome b [Rhodospirillales bacterium]|nr:cytochrome b [Rhodospirillales bacterium]
MTNITDTPQRFGTVSMALHWALALLMIGVFVLGQIMEELPRGPEKVEMIFWHASFGLLILGLALGRLVWRWTQTTPLPPADETALQKLAHRIVVITLYLIPIALGLTGMAAVASTGNDISFFGLFSIPGMEAFSKTVHEAAEETHEVFVKILVITVIAHTAAAIWHHLIRHDTTLSRMLPGS